MILPNINPIIFSIGPFSISWYSLSYVVGILLGWFYATKIIEKFKPEITKKHIEDFITYAIIGIIVGGRLGYVLLYNPLKYFANPIEILKTYEGGMSFHGATIGIIISAYLFCQKYKINFLSLTDIITTVVPIGLFLGRIANFINCELYGRITNSSFGIIFPNSDLEPRHPSQLYEAFFEGLILFCILAYAVFRHDTLKKQGLNSGIYLIFYSLFRIIIEMFREPDIQIGFILDSLTMGQILSAPMLLLGSYLICRLNSK
ncbi:prolipoprotein diacylglyceryl transferase [Rickettsia typhi]|uniref:Phosphatidylglycerol--prolipoprotein diacylglyceryl transferase n=2 Tax=Rickettsia typhi TaxID=785 RepID=LGT_RICTY|nr:prolipoprotein diacylglyceryl transferase [Rickettsia typhi]Q68XS2.1 RecName: Full=Phosphatidylglycerol--prolipoprotein diacylglyceryl transferase [Rickettsia typhi str. Wilmington]AAU03570.1 prolipoprotein diacylglyceryl transferase [Rickettsia typhi str. Wilmington]AFE53949.1 prolipoprotein diacylglyceryl transferase [Rickettsia typhi str. TH1527]AFE54787.1 prolipoprotein diacylglyceryl transferase [Rickettsia typhi str. B9991CWPP]